jgi:ribonuclease D
MNAGLAPPHRHLSRQAVSGARPTDDSSGPACYAARMTIHLHQGDLPHDVFAPGPIAVDSETMGLVPGRDRLCLLQLADGHGDEHLVRFSAGNYDAPVLKSVLADPSRLKLFHFARFDLAVIKQYLGIDATPVFCTKIASKLVRTYTDRHGLKDVLRETIGVDISKAQQSSDWGADELSEAQKDYAASDVRYLHRAHAVLVERLAREGRTAMAQACFDFLPTRAALDLAGWPETDIFAHM